MSFQEAVQSALIRKYADFQGRAARPEFWWFMLAIALATLVASILDEFVLRGGSILETLVGLGTVIPSLAVGARRLHDTDRSGWWLLLHLLPLIGVIVLIVWWAQPGEAGRKRFGEPPTA